jgi:hypothetical protein
VRDHPVGRRLEGGYLLETETARGATRSVFRATAGDGRSVAAKRLLGDPHGARQEIEARMLRALYHPRIAKVHDLIEDPSGRYLITDWIEGTTLAAVLEREGDPGLPPSRVLAWVLQAADGLAYLHEQQTVHRDVKPANLVLSPDRGVVVVDLGAARPPAGTAGDPGCMAPELLDGGPVTAAADVYGLAASAWTLIAGSPPRADELRPLRGATTALTRALHAALTADPKARTTSMAALADGLGGSVGGGGRDMTVTAAVDPSRRPLLQSVVRAAAGCFGAAAASLALARRDGSLVYVAAWGAGAEEIVGRELGAGEGIAGRALATGRCQVIADVRGDRDWASGFARGTGYVPASMLVMPLSTLSGGFGALALLDRRDGRPFDMEDVRRAQLFAYLAVDALQAGAERLPTVGTSFEPEG